MPSTQPISQYPEIGRGAAKREDDVIAKEELAKQQEAVLEDSGKSMIE
jgi:hypothetical protein